MRALLSIPIVLFASISAAGDEQDGERRLSLEELLERARARRAEQRERLGEGVEAALAGFAQLSAPIPPAKLEAFAAELAALGPEAAPLLVPYLEPAGSSEELDLLRSRAVAQALGRINSLAITDALLALLTSGSEAGRIHALEVLGSSPEPARVRPALAAVFEGQSGAIKQAALKALIRMGGPENQALLSGVLQSDADELVNLALSALFDTRAAQAAGEVRALLASNGRGARHASLLLAYYRALPELADDGVVGLLAVLARNAPRVETRLEILAALPDLAASSASEVRRALEPLATSEDRSLREAALVALVRLGDRNAQRELLRAYDSNVDKNDRFPDAYLRRAEILMRIQHWDDAIRDFKEALRFSRDDSRPQREVYIGLARAFARKGRQGDLKEAAEWLRRAPISQRELAALADDPDFRELRASRYGKEAFGP